MNDELLMWFWFFIAFSIITLIGGAALYFVSRKEKRDMQERRDDQSITFQDSFDWNDFKNDS